MPGKSLALCLVAFARLAAGAVEARGVVARYAKDGGQGRGEFVVCVRITEMETPDAGRFRAYLRSLSRG